ncbi:MAG: DUF362 domain-containing protein [Acidobacteria bacterium]|nr:DUF362 domain-containing protein [Acidobacteriota bacterium]
MTHRLTRRDLAALLGAGAVSRVLGASQARSGRGRVGTAEIPPHARPAAFSRAVGDAVRRSTGMDTAEAAFRGLFGRRDTVGIKVNCLGGPRMSPRPALVEALVEWVAGAGVERSRIIVFERSSRELETAGFTLRKKGGASLCYGIDNDYDRAPTVTGKVASCFARMVSTTCTALISVGVVKDHDFAGVSAGLKNWYGVIHNPNKYHDSNCDPYVADVVRHPWIGGKMRLTVLDGGRAQYQGGPAFANRGVFDLGMVAASHDPVAADAWAWRMVEEERARRALGTLEDEKRAPRFIQTASRYGLGVGDVKALKVVGA